MPMSSKDKYLQEVLSYIKFTFDRENIRYELECHIQDKIEYYMEQGYDENKAEQLSVEDMGDAKTTGIELNKQHNPLIGWILKITNVLIILLLIWNTYAIGGVILISLFRDNLVKKIPQTDIVYKIDIDEKVKLDDTVIHFTNVVYEKNGKMNIFYEYYDTKLLGSGWSLGSIGNITDNLGNTYQSGSAGSYGGIKTKCLHTVNNFSQEADILIISYDYYNRKYKVEIPLQAGGSNE